MLIETAAPIGDDEIAERTTIPWPGGTMRWCPGFSRIVSLLGTSIVLLTDSVGFVTFGIEDHSARFANGDLQLSLG
ncbi:hypothetical protein [Stieleria neptunia]|uniref:hypothetical protein n=1 Tax=Stieleria neptunia TaxID=2527979 RepID=UPI0011A8DB0A|nr:hypothetical protein [Stieleria neptunia]